MTIVPNRNIVFRITSFALVLALCGFLGGCVSNDKSDLEAYVNEILARKGGQIEPLPPIKPYERYLYRAAELNLRDPFQSFLAPAARQQEIEIINNADQQRYNDEIATHNREELENFELDGLRMVGLLEDEEELWGIILDSAGAVHRVQIGNYMGQNFGKIINIQEDRIDLRELVRDGRGGLEERQASLALIDPS